MDWKNIMKKKKNLFFGFSGEQHGTCLIQCSIKVDIIFVVTRHVVNRKK